MPAANLPPRKHCEQLSQFGLLFACLWGVLAISRIGGRTPLASIAASDVLEVHSSNYDFRSEANLSGLIVFIGPLSLGRRLLPWLLRRLAGMLPRFVGR
jgi:hypothetical protein